MSKITLVQRPALRADQRARGEAIYNTRMGHKLPVAKVAKLIAAKGSTVAEADVLAVLHNLGEVIVTEVMHGMAVEVPGLGSVHVFANGVVDKDGNDISPRGRQFRMVMNFKKALQRLAISPENIAVTIQQFTHKTPILTRVTDALSGLDDAVLTRGGMAGLRGKNLRFNPLQADEGLWFLPEDAGYTVRAEVFLDNKPSRLNFTVPTTLQPGAAYRMEVRNRARHSKTLVTGCLSGTITAVD